MPSVRAGPTRAIEEQATMPIQPPLSQRCARRRRSGVRRRPTQQEHRKRRERILARRRRSQLTPPRAARLLVLSAPAPPRRRRRHVAEPQCMLPLPPFAVSWLCRPSPGRGLLLGRAAVIRLSTTKMRSTAGVIIARHACTPMKPPPCWRNGTHCANDYHSHRRFDDAREINARLPRQAGSRDGRHARLGHDYSALCPPCAISSNTSDDAATRRRRHGLDAIFAMYEFMPRYDCLTGRCAAPAPIRRMQFIFSVAIIDVVFMIRMPMRGGAYFIRRDEAELL